MARKEARRGRAPPIRTSNVGTSGFLAFMKPMVEARARSPPITDNHPNQKLLPAVDQYSPDHTLTLAPVILSVPVPNPYV